MAVKEALSSGTRQVCGGYLLSSNWRSLPQRDQQKRLSCFVTGILDLRLGEGGESTAIFTGCINKETSTGVVMKDDRNEGYYINWFSELIFWKLKPMWASTCWGGWIVIACNLADSGPGRKWSRTSDTTELSLPPAVLLYSRKLEPWKNLIKFNPGRGERLASRRTCGHLEVWWQTDGQRPGWRRKAKWESLAQRSTEKLQSSGG